MMHNVLNLKNGLVNLETETHTMGGFILPCVFLEVLNANWQSF